MKIRYTFIVVFFIFITPCYGSVNNNEFLAQELLNNIQDNEVLLSINNNSEPAIQEIYSETNKKNENDKDDMTDPIESVFEMFDSMGKNKDTSENSLFSKVLKSKITRTDIPSFLLNDELTFDYKKGPISQTHFYAGYRGSLNALLINHGDNSFDYDNLTTETGVYGKFRNPNYAFKLKVKPIPVKGLNYIDSFIGDAYITNNQIPHHKIILGYSRVQTGVEGGSSSFILPFVARSQIARNFGNARSISAKLIGNYEYADYSLAFGSSGRYITSGMPGTEFTGRFNLKPFGSHDHPDKKYGKLTIGGGINVGHNRIDYAVGSFYIGYKHKNLWTNFESAIADGYSGSNGISSKKASGFAYTIGWKFNPYLQLIGRIDQFNPDRNVSHNKKREYTAGINWFIKGQALKLVLNYVYCQNQGSKDSHKIILATQVML